MRFRLNLECRKKSSQKKKIDPRQTLHNRVNSLPSSPSRKEVRKCSKEVAQSREGTTVQNQFVIPVGETAHEEPLEERLCRMVMSTTPSLKPIISRLTLTAAHDVTALLNGETGTGKSFLARLIHDHSPRKNHRFLPVPCGAISGNLMESEFFGHVKGAFTGADQAKVGKFAAVGQGTLLLDEIDTLSLEQQAALLRVIETGEFEPVGSTETQKCNARLIVASNIDLEEAVKRGKFRSDLYFRLNVMSFYLPPLRDRMRDIPILAWALVSRFNSKFGKDIRNINHRVLSALETYAWPGNIRQLENVIQNAVLVSTGPELLPRYLPQDIQAHIPVAIPYRSAQNRGSSLHSQRDLLEKQIIQRALLENAHSRSRAAASLGISRVALYKKLKKFGLTVREGFGSAAPTCTFGPQ
jgi:transcriptional regulator with PAS, ATPase and Fis domain